MQHLTAWQMIGLALGIGAALFLWGCALYLVNEFFDRMDGE